MDLRAMRHFVAVAEELHFGRAARRLHMAQPPLSQSIRRLETALGVELFNRSRRSVELTDAGRVFLNEARRTLMQADVACKLAQRAGNNAHQIRVSFIGPALYQLLPDLIVRYRAAAPEVHVLLFEEPSPAQFKGIQAGEYDVGFVTAGLPEAGDFERMLVERAPYLAAVPANGPLQARHSISLAELAEQPFILPPRKYAASSETLSIFKNAGVVPRLAQEASQTNTVLSLVGAGLGCSLVMATAALGQPRNVHFLTIEDDLPDARWELGMVWNAQRLSMLAHDFIRFVGEYVQETPHLLDGTWTCPANASATGAGGAAVAR